MGKTDSDRNEQFYFTDWLSAEFLASFSCTKNELAGFFDLDVSMPIESAVVHHRAKLKPEALEAIFKKFNSLVAAVSNGAGGGSDLIVADGSAVTFFSKPKFLPDSYFVAEGHSAKGFYSIHTNAL